MAIIESNNKSKSRPKFGSIEHRAKAAAQQRKNWASGVHDHQRTGRVPHKKKCPKCFSEFESLSIKRKFCTFECAMISRMKGDARPMSNNRSDREKLRYRTDPVFRLKKIIKQGLRRMIKGLPGTAKAQELVGCTREQLMAHLQSLFRGGMNWLNHGIGKGKWQIDHIVPCASFGTSEAELRRCWNWTNLRPIWAVRNGKKGAKITHLNAQPQLPLCRT